ncbi:MAG: outer membrane protein assembly factor BamD [bacterium]
MLKTLIYKRLYPGGRQNALAFQVFKISGLFFLLVFMLTACASAPVKEKAGPEAYYNEAMKELKGGWIFGPDYEQARQTLNQIIDNYPYSTYAPLAQLRIADSYFKEGRYLEAAEAYDHFVKMYPNNKDIPYAIFMEGRSFLENQKSWLSGDIPYDIDPTGIYNAYDEFRYIVDNYPSSEYADKAKQYALQCERALANHDLYIADFYISHDHYEAAINRLKTVYEKYPDSGVADKALYKLAEVYKKINSPEQYEQTIKLLKELYPDSRYNK